MKSLVIAKKEIMDLTRDRRTMMMMFVVPLFFCNAFDVCARF